MHTIKLAAVGTSTGAVFPVQLLKELKVTKGDTLFITETPSGYLLTPYDPAMDEQIKLGRAFMSKYRDTLRALAK